MFLNYTIKNFLSNESAENLRFEETKKRSALCHDILVGGLVWNIHTQKQKKMVRGKKGNPPKSIKSGGRIALWVVGTDSWRATRGPWD